MKLDDLRFEDDIASFSDLEQTSEMLFKVKIAHTTVQTTPSHGQRSHTKSLPDGGVFRVEISSTVWLQNTRVTDGRLVVVIR